MKLKPNIYRFRIADSYVFRVFGFDIDGNPEEIETLTLDHRPTKKEMEKKYDRHIFSIVCVDTNYKSYEITKEAFFANATEVITNKSK